MVINMANHDNGAKGRKVGVGNIQPVKVRVTAGPATTKETLAKTILENAVVVRSHSAHKVAAARLVNSMDLDEMLEASKVIDMGIKGEKIPVAKSSKAQRYAREILQLSRTDDTKPIAEKMMHDLTVRIIEVNKKTTDETESKRLYRKLMVEE